MREILIGFLFALFPILLFSKNIHIFLDMVPLRATDTSVYYEVMYAIPDTCFHYSRGENGYEGHILLQIIISLNGEEIINDVSRITAVSPVQVHTFRNTVVGWKHYHLPAGSGSLILKAYSLPDRKDSVVRSYPLHVVPFPRDRLALSKPILLQHIRPAEPGDDPRFVLNGLYLLPNPTRLIASENPKLMLYQEVYNADRYAPQGYRLTYRIYDVIRRNVWSTQLERKSTRAAVVEYLNTSLESLPTGVYTVEVVLHPITTGDSVRQQGKFFLLNPNLPPIPTEHLAELADFQKSPFATMTAEQVEREFEQLQPLLPEKDIALYKSLTDLTAKQKYLFRFWLLQDPDPTTPINEAREDFLKRIEYANKHFSSPQFPEGWRSDRGRVLRLYGNPDEIDRYPMTGESPAYQIWKYYNLDGGVYFVFIDFQGTNNYRLIHSTKRGELYDPYWEEKYIKQKGVGPNYQDRRVPFEQRDYFPGNSNFPD